MLGNVVLKRTSCFSIVYKMYKHLISLHNLKSLEKQIISHVYQFEEKSVSTSYDINLLLSVHCCLLDTKCGKKYLPHIRLRIPPAHNCKSLKFYLANLLSLYSGILSKPV